MHCEELEKEWKEKLAEWDKHMRGEIQDIKPFFLVFPLVFPSFSLVFPYFSFVIPYRLVGQAYMRGEIQDIKPFDMSFSQRS